MLKSPIPRAYFLNGCLLTSVFALFVITTILWVAGGWQGLATIPIMLAHWLSIVTLSASFTQFFTNDDL